MAEFLWAMLGIYTGVDCNSNATYYKRGQAERCRQANPSRKENSCRVGLKQVRLLVKKVSESSTSQKMQLQLILLLFAVKLAEQLPLPHEEDKNSAAGKLVHKART